MTWLHIVDGKITASLANEDTLGLLIQLGALPGALVPAGPPSPEKNKALVNRYFNEVMNQGKLETIDEIVAPDFTFRIPTLPEPVHGPEGFEQFVKGLRKAFPDIHFTVEQEIVARNKVAARWTLTGTHLGNFLNIPPTGKRVTDQGIDLFYIAKDKIVEMWVNEQDLELLRQLGAIPSKLPTRS
ncbi:MAG: ester cyclase [Ktedonobacteraceae bacterium]|nr:ester cyclase [Ktedonobacteraceae bacterium]